LGGLAGAVSTGFCVSVGCPLTSPGREDIPGSLAGAFASSVGLGAGGRATLPGAVAGSEVEGLVRVSVADPLLDDLL
jgi:hypothetical protein